MHAKLKYRPGCRDRQATMGIPVHENIIRPSARNVSFTPQKLTILQETKIGYFAP